MTNLDDERSFSSLDSGNMAAQIAGFPDACAAAWEQAQSVSLPPAYRAVSSVVVFGMGGSAISGDLARTLGSNMASVSIEVVRGYHVPGYVDNKTLAVAISFSGDTEETLVAFDAAAQKTTQQIVIAGGGALQARAQGSGIPHYPIRNVRKQPRTALPHLYMPVLHALSALGIIFCPSAAVLEAIQFVAEQAPKFDVTVPERRNPAKQLARALHGRIVSIYGAEFLSEVARRWKTQINENSKQWAEFEHLPEANHNAVVGFGHPAANTSVLQVVQLQSSLYHNRTRFRMEVTRELLKTSAIAGETITVQGPTPLAQQLYGTLLGDYVSYYLALLNDVDPTPVANIEFVKSQLTSAM
ncbi:MAG: bifunctional phosphoglucose/phosphomannose isomerase [Chloroflexi bacterium]|nr:bifunctional phosphoglucose/phosphomannose isomerase [Chloroflexota bacterium]